MDRGPAEPGAGRAATLATAGRKLAAGLAALVRTRGELAAVELAELREYERAILACGAAGAVAMLLAGIGASALVVALAGEPYRVVAIAAVTAAWTILGLACLLRARRLARACPRPFAATLAALGEDVDLLRRGRR